MDRRIDRRSFVRAGLTGVGLFAVVTACTGDSSASRETLGEVAISPLRDGPPRTIAMVGDSITFMSAEPIERGLTDLGLDVLAVDAQVGRRMTVGTDGGLYAGTDVVEYIAAGTPPDLWVIALGTNDIGQYADVAAYEAQVRELLAAVPTGAPLAWVDTWHRDRLAECELLNGVLRTVLAERDRTVVVDWYSHGDDDGVVSGDGVHPTDAGTEVFGLVVTDGVQTLIEGL